jgi:hypothetical protein
MLRAAHHIEAPVRFQLSPAKPAAQSEGRIIIDFARAERNRADRANGLTQKNASAGGDGKRFVVRVTSWRRDRTLSEAASQTAIAVRPGAGEEARSRLCQLCNAISGIDSR